MPLSSVGQVSHAVVFFAQMRRVVCWRQLSFLYNRCMHMDICIHTDVVDVVVYLIDK